MAYTITLSDSDLLQVDAVTAMADAVTLRDPDFNGAVINVIPGDFTAVDGPDAINNARLMIMVNYVLRPEN